MTCDTIGRTKYRPDSEILDLIEAVAGAGHVDRLMVTNPARAFSVGSETP